MWQRCKNFCQPGNESFLYGRSTANQRIEMFWNFLCKQCCQVWIDALAELKDIGEFTGEFIDTNLSQLSLDSHKKLGEQGTI
jgi:hypothetical protein